MDKRRIGDRDRISDEEAYHLRDDLLSGAQEIADFLGFKRRRVFHLIERGELPCFRIDSLLHARKSTLVHWISQLEDEAARERQGKSRRKDAP